MLIPSGHGDKKKIQFYQEVEGNVEVIALLSHVVFRQLSPWKWSYKKTLPFYHFADQF